MGITPITDASGLMDQLTMPGVNPVQSTGSGSDFKTIWSDQAANSATQTDKLTNYVAKDNADSDVRKDAAKDDNGIRNASESNNDQVDRSAKDNEVSKTDVKGTDSPDETAKAVNDDKSGGVLKDEDIESAQEVLAATIADLVQKITEILGTTPEEFENLLQTEGIDKMQLLDGEVLSSVLVKALGAESRLSLLTDETNYDLFNRSMEVLNDLLGKESGIENLSIGELKELVSKTVPVNDGVSAEDTVISGEESLNTSSGEATKPETVRYERDSDGNFIRTNVDGAGKETGEASIVTEAAKPEKQTRDSGDKKSGEHENPLMQGSSQTPEIKPEGTDQVQNTAFSYNTSVNEIAEQILERMKTVTDGDYSDVEMQLHPASLGTLHIHVTNNAGVLTASFVTENEAVRSAVESQMVRLIEQFESQGIKIEAVEVTVASHAFEQGNDAGRSNESNEGNPRRSRRINLGDYADEEGIEGLNEEEKIAAEMMAANGNTVDFMAQYGGQLMSSVSATVKNGEIVTSASQDSLSTKTNESNSGMDKDAFLQLLVAQMKYQDPLEPTSNTEYISQYAQFSQVEALNNMSTTMELSRYSSYVGKEVVIESTDSSGKTTQTRGFVDYVTFEEGKAYFSIEGNLYKAEDMVTVISNEYSNAEDIAKKFAETIKDLPGVDSINVNDHGNTSNNLYNLYNSIGDYEKGFLDEDDVKAMEKYVAKLNELLVQLANEAALEQQRKEAEAAAAAQAQTQQTAEETTPVSGDSSEGDAADTQPDDTAIAENAASQGAVTPEED